MTSLQSLTIFREGGATASGLTTSHQYPCQDTFPISASLTLKWYYEIQGAQAVGYPHQNISRNSCSELHTSFPLIISNATKCPYV